MSISQLEVCQEGGGSRRGYLEDFGVFLTGDMEDMVVPGVMNDVFLPQGRYPENFMLISQLEVCQEWGVNKRGTWRLSRETWRPGSSLMSWMMIVHP